MTVAVIDSGVANLASVMAALARLNVVAEVTFDADKIRTADRVILPGVGAAPAAMKQLEARKLTDVIRGLSQPVLGICLGMQLLFEKSDEGNAACLGVLPGQVKRMMPAPGLPVPHMGWNQIQLRDARHPLLKNIPADSFVYFVHGFAVPVSAVTLASADYSGALTAVAARGNFFGCQFHPERSGMVGQQILRNFLELA